VAWRERWAVDVDFNILGVGQVGGHTVAWGPDPDGGWSSRIGAFSNTTGALVASTNLPGRQRFLATTSVGKTMCGLVYDPDREDVRLAQLSVSGSQIGAQEDGVVIAFTTGQDQGPFFWPEAILCAWQTQPFEGFAIVQWSNSDMHGDTTGPPDFNQTRTGQHVFWRTPGRGWSPFPSRLQFMSLVSQPILSGDDFVFMEQFRINRKVLATEGWNPTYPSQFGPAPITEGGVVIEAMAFAGSKPGWAYNNLVILET
jgi:hypothetical protein